MFTYAVKAMITNIYPKSVLKYLPIALTALAIARSLLAEHGVRFVNMLVCFLLGSQQER